MKNILPKDQYQVVQTVGGMVIIAGGYQYFSAAVTDAEWAGKHCGGRWSVRYAGGKLGVHYPLNRELASMWAGK